MPRHNMLTSALPSTVMVGGNEFPINTDFRIGIRFDELTRSKSLKDSDKFVGALILYYGEDGIPRDMLEAHNALLKFYMCGKLDEEKKQPQDKKNAKRVYDYAHDGQYIYAAFYDQYHIDLTEADLHWWKFRAMFAGLKPENEIVKIMGYRASDTARIKNKDERARVRSLKQLYALPEEATVEEMQKKAGAMFGAMFG